MTKNLKHTKATNFYDLEPIICDLHRWVDHLAFKCCDDLGGISLQIVEQILKETENLKTTFNAAHKAQRKTHVEDGFDKALEQVTECHYDLAIWRLKNDDADLPEDLVEELTQAEGKLCSTPARSLASLKKKIAAGVKAGTPTEGEWLSAIHADLEAMEG